MMLACCTSKSVGVNVGDMNKFFRKPLNYNSIILWFGTSPATTRLSVRFHKTPWISCPGWSACADPPAPVACLLQSRWGGGRGFIPLRCDLKAAWGACGLNHACLALPRSIRTRSVSVQFLLFHRLEGRRDASRSTITVGRRWRYGVWQSQK